MENEPISNGGNGRGPNGRFLPGNPGGPGSPRARSAIELASRFDEAMSRVCAVERIEKALDACLKKAEEGDAQALRIIAERIKGPPQAYSLTAEVEELLARQAALEADLHARFGDGMGRAD